MKAEKSNNKPRREIDPMVIYEMARELFTTVGSLSQPHGKEVDSAIEEAEALLKALKAFKGVTP
jgi:hypothetical protein